MDFVALSFLSTLQKLLGDVFDKTLVPVIQDVISILINMAGKLIQDILSNFLLKILIILLKVIYFLEQIFNIFSGVNPVMVGKGDVSKKMTLLEYFFQIDDVKRAFLLITMIAVVLAFLTTMIAVGKSISDMALEMKNPLSQVLRQSLRAVINFMMIPFLCLFLLQLATQLTIIVNSSMNSAAGNMSMSDLIFVSCATDGADSATLQKYQTGQKYEDAERVNKDFDITKINYVLGYMSTAMVALLLLAAIIQFIRRIVEILLLYLAAPFVVATMPLDEGAKLKEWKEQFVARMFSAFGPIMMMKIYFLAIPFLVSDKVSYGMNDWMEGSVKLFLVIGGAYAVYKSQHMLTTILNPTAAGSMAESGFLGAMLGQKLTSAVKGDNKNSGRGGRGSSGQYKTKSQAYTGK